MKTLHIMIIIFTLLLMTGCFSLEIYEDDADEWPYSDIGDDDDDNDNNDDNDNDDAEDDEELDEGERDEVVPEAAEEFEENET